MKEQMTSAAANKKLRNLEDEKQYLLSMERSAATYIETEGVEPTKPKYDYIETADKLDEINNEVLELKHAINLFNCNTEIPSLGITIDQALVRMAQLNQRKITLDVMRKRFPKIRKDDEYGGNSMVEYICTNYDIDTVKKEYDMLSEEIINLQMEIDRLNQTVKFNV